MKTHFEMMAEYSAWANARLYRMAAQVPDESFGVAEPDSLDVLIMLREKRG